MCCKPQNDKDKMIETPRSKSNKSAKNIKSTIDMKRELNRTSEVENLAT